jgi:NAD+ synthase (glutamine-hydrolysing)
MATAASFASSTTRLAGAALNQTPLDWAGNRANILAAIAAAKEESAFLLCLPELCVTGYGCEDLFLSDWVAQRAWQELLQIRQHADTLVACVGLPLRMQGITYNGVAVLYQRKILGISLKQNLARDGVHYEPRWFTAWPPGRTVQWQAADEVVSVGDLVYEVEGVRFGFEICEDAWRPERPGHSLYARGVHLIVNPSASHFALQKSALREKLVTNSSRQFDCTYLYVNALGNEAGRMIYDGDVIVAQRGRLLASGARLQFGPLAMTSTNVDVHNTVPADSVSGTTIPTNEEFAQAVALGLFDYLRKSRAKGFVLSLSGGADSACCAVLVSEMVRRASRYLGWKAFCEQLGIGHVQTQREAVQTLLTCAYQATVNSSATTLEAAQTLAQSMGAVFHYWRVADEVKGYQAKIEEALGRTLEWQQDDIALQNIQARARSPIIWMLANINKALLLTTSNRSEGDVGYATMDGDTSGSLAPIAGIDKPFIRQWLRWAERDLGYTGLSLVNNLEPTAELRPAERQQTDEADLMPYDVLVAIEKLAFVERLSPVQVYQKLRSEYDAESLKKYIKKFFVLWAANQWKRERLAPSFHLDSLNVDPRSWLRFPILSGGYESELREVEGLD